MSNVAKFLIVMNLILAGVFVGFAASYLGQKDYVQENYRTEVAGLKGQVEAARTELDKVNAKNRELGANNTELKASVAALEAAKALLTTENQTINANMTQLSESHGHAVKALELQNDTIRAYESNIKALQEERTKLVESRNAEHEARTKAEAVQAQLQRQLDDETSAHKAAEGALGDANAKIQTLQAEIEGWKAKFPNVDAPTAQPAVAPGKVLAVDNEMGLVVTSLGEEDGVRVGHEFIVSRGSKYVATITITDVQAKKSTGMVVAGMKTGPISNNDTVMR
jgi:predicted  nucleic acid-binding Zn-ribbon protein